MMMLALKCVERLSSAQTRDVEGLEVYPGNVYLVQVRTALWATAALLLQDIGTRVEQSSGKYLHKTDYGSSEWAHPPSSATIQ